jgi:hypothetical protein
MFWVIKHTNGEAFFGFFLDGLDNIEIVKGKS